MALAGRTLDRVASLPRYPVIIAGSFGDAAADIKGVTWVSRSTTTSVLRVQGAPDIYAVFLQDASEANSHGYSYNGATGELTIESATALSGSDKVDILILAKGSSVSSGQ